MNCDVNAAGRARGICMCGGCVSSLLNTKGFLNTKRFSAYIGLAACAQAQWIYTASGCIRASVAVQEL